MEFEWVVPQLVVAAIDSLEENLVVPLLQKFDPRILLVVKYLLVQYLKLVLHVMMFITSYPLRVDRTLLND